jgi:hypothetical protein
MIASAIGFTFDKATRTKTLYEHRTGTIVRTGVALRDLQEVRAELEKDIPVETEATKKDQRVQR